MHARWIKIAWLALAAGAVSASRAESAEAMLAKTAFPTPAPFSAAPQPWPTSLLGAIPGRSYLPPAVPGPPRLAEAAKQRPISARPARDLPAVAWVSGLTLRGPYLKPAGPPARAASPELTASPWRDLAPDPSRADVRSDPVQDPVRGALLAAGVEVRQQPAPFQRLTLPDPLEFVPAVRLQSLPPDDDAPVTGPIGLPKPLLPLQTPVPPKP